MLGKLLAQVKDTLTHIALMYVAKASVAIPFILAFGFGVAAIASMLVERFNYEAGYWMMAGGMAVLGAGGAVAVYYKERQADEASEPDQSAPTAWAAVDPMTRQAATQLPLVVLGTVLTMPGGGQAALQGARMMGRHLPLLGLATLVAFLLWPTSENTGRSTSSDEADEPDALSRPIAGRAMVMSNGNRFGI